MTKETISPRRPVRVKGWAESRLDQFLLRAVMEPLPWWQAIARWLVTTLARLTLSFGRTFPLLYRPWYRLSQIVRYMLDQRRHETVKTIFLRRLFSLQRPDDGRFRVSYAVCNWIVAIFLLTLVPDCLEALYVYSTYPFGTYHDVIVTEAYPKQKVVNGVLTDTNTFAVHGYQTNGNEKRELYFELGPNIWFIKFTPEYTFGQIPKLGRCTFETYGIMLRIPRKLRLLAPGSLYALNPWIVDMQCIAPNIVPAQEKH
jgi:hypothetical protein